MIIIKYIISLLFTFLATMILVPFNIKFAKKFNFIDKPHQRGLHKNPVPFGGGLSFAIPIILVQIWGYFIFETQLLYLAIGSFLILLLGFLDDKIKVTANYKLLFQIIIITVIYFFGFKIELLTNPFGETINLGIFSLPITMIWFLIVINAFNLIDGLDGLAAGIALISVTVLFAVGFMKSNEIIMFLSLSIIGANFAFLKYNFYPAKIFMGDTGSLFLGFNIAAISIAGNGEFMGITSMTLLVPIIILTIPLMDIMFAIIRRIKLKKHIFRADKQHIHHKLHEIGISQKNVALISYFITFLFGLIAFGFSFSSKKILLATLLGLLIVLLIIVYYLFKKEFRK